MIIPSRHRTVPAAMAVAAAAAGAMVALHYQRLDLTLSHYDARSHLVVARRIADSITPGWQQIGAVWLPLPHLLNAVPVQVDVFYRTGASAVAISIAAFALATGAVSWIVLALTGSAVAAVTASAVFALNPNVLYLQATPMTEPLFLALTLVAVAMLIDWCRVEPQGNTRMLGIAFALACLTRYEAWPVTVCALFISVCVLRRKGHALITTSRRVSAIAAYPALAVAFFIVFSRVVTGEWATVSGFFVPENTALGKPVEAVAELLWGARALSGPLTLSLAAIGLCALLVMAIGNRHRAELPVVFALLASAALPWAAFVDGHPFRIRYMIPLIPVAAIGVGLAVAQTKRAALLAVPVLALLLAYEIRPLDASAPMVLEAKWDRPNVAPRRRLTECLRAGYDGEKIMASMGSLGHYMQETARDGFTIRDFLHEGNGDIWLAALDEPRPYAGWLLIEEKAEGGDMLAMRARAKPEFLDGYDRVCEGAGLALYRRREPAHRP